MDILIYFVIFFIALIIGSLCSIIGIGGNSIFIPILVIFYNIEIHIAIATMLFSSIFFALSSTLLYAKSKVIDFKLAFILEITTASGALIASQISLIIPTENLEIIFGISMLCVSLYMILSNYFPFLKKSGKCEFDDNQKLKWYQWKRKYYIKEKKGVFIVNLPLALSVSLIAGLIVGLTGVAGGTIKVPLIHLICGAPMILAVGTSFLMIIITGVFASIGYFFSNYINFILAIPIILGLILGSQIGSHFALKLTETKLKIIFGIIIFIFSLLILL